MLISSSVLAPFFRAVHLCLRRGKRFERCKGRDGTQEARKLRVPASAAKAHSYYRESRQEPACLPGLAELMLQAQRHLNELLLAHLLQVALW